MLKRSLHIAHEISRLHVEKIGTDCNVAVNTQAIARLIALELVKAVAEAVAAEREACAEIAATMGGPWMECDANGDGYQEAREHIAIAIRSRGDVK